MLTEKYKPMQLSEFVGLEKPKKMIGNWLENPQTQSFLFVGKPGTGKTAMAEAIGKAVGAQACEIVQIPSGKCDQKTVEQLWRDTQYLPWGNFRVYIVNEADRMTDGAQIAFLSLLDSMPVKTIFIFTCNETTGLETRFLSRCMVIEFSNYGMNGCGSRFLAEVWRKECVKLKAQPLFPPDFTRILKNCGNNLRGALNSLESLLLES